MVDSERRIRLGHAIAICPPAIFVNSSTMGIFSKNTTGKRAPKFPEKKVMDDCNLGSSPFPVKVSNNTIEFVGPQTLRLNCHCDVGI